MSSGNAVTQAAVSRIGQRCQVVIPKRVFDELNLRASDFVEVSAESGRLQMLPMRLVDIGDETLTARETIQVQRGEAEIKAGNSRSWRAIRDELSV